MYESKLTLNKPVYASMTILDNSKNLMYEFFYEHLKMKYGPKCELIYTDTDSLLLEIQTEDIYKDMAEDIDLHDTSDYPNDHPLYSDKNKKLLGNMRDECAGKPIAECVCVFKVKNVLNHESGRKNIKNAKGVKKNVVKKHIKHEEYKEALFDTKQLRYGMNILRNDGHEIYGMHMNKVSLSLLIQNDG